MRRSGREERPAGNCSSGAVHEDAGSGADDRRSNPLLLTTAAAAVAAAEVVPVPP